MTPGGKREGAGRPKGSISKKTIEKKIVEAELHSRILGAVDRIFESQLSLARGCAYLYRIDETGEGSKKKREHVIVTDPDEIKKVLDETEAAGGVVDDNYYYVTTVTPDNRAIDSMLDRVFGKAKQALEHSGPNGSVIPVAVTVDL
jgi:hypothetical protein